MAKRKKIDPKTDPMAKIYKDRHNADVYKEPDGSITIEHPGGLKQYPGKSLKDLNNE